MVFINNLKELIYNNIPIISLVGVAYLLDFITGISKAIYLKNVKSSKLRKSIGKGLSYFAYVIMSVCLQFIFPIVIDVSKYIPIINIQIYFFIWLMCLYIILTEFISVNENAKKFTTGIPFIDKFLKSTKEKIDNIDINEQ